jgi:hypothetical protein
MKTKFRIKLDYVISIETGGRLPQKFDRVNDIICNGLASLELDEDIDVEPGAKMSINIVKK